MKDIFVSSNHSSMKSSEMLLLSSFCESVMHRKTCGDESSTMKDNSRQSGVFRFCLVLFYHNGRKTRALLTPGGGPDRKSVV